MYEETVADTFARNSVMYEETVANVNIGISLHP
jgi:hypothetical protein